MRLLFEINYHKGKLDGEIFRRDSARCLAICKNKIAMIFSKTNKYYKFPGGGIENGETAIQAMIREAREEAGLIVIPRSVREYGYVHRVLPPDLSDNRIFIQDNFYFLCDVENTVVPQSLELSEQRECFILEWIDPNKAIEINFNVDFNKVNRSMIERECGVLKLLISEKYFKQ